MPRWNVCAIALPTGLVVVKQLNGPSPHQCHSLCSLNQQVHSCPLWAAKLRVTLCMCVCSKGLYITDRLAEQIEIMWARPKHVLTQSCCLWRIKLDKLVHLDLKCSISFYSDKKLNYYSMLLTKQLNYS